MNQSLLRRLDQHLQQRIDDQEIPGCVTNIWRDGVLVHSNMLGWGDVERQSPVADDTVYRAFSMTKPIVSVALMQCVEKGLLQLNDPVHQFIPGWRDMQVSRGSSGIGLPIRTPCDRPMTVHDLMTHQSGLPAPAGIAEAMAGTRKRTLLDLVEDLAHMSLDFQPGSAFSYGVSTDVVGHLVEVLSGESLDRYLREHIFGPLDMADTGFWVEPKAHDRLAALYSSTAGGLVLIDDPITSALLQPTSYFSGGGGLVTTSSDYARFALMLRGRGTLDGTRIIGRKTLDLMTVNHLASGRSIASSTADPFFADYHGQGFGLGFGINLSPAEAQLPGSPGEYNWTGAAGTLVAVDPKEDLVILYMTQALPDVPSRGYRNPYRWRELRALIYAALE